MSANCKIEIVGQSGRTVQIDYYPYSGGGPIDLGVHQLPYCYDCSFCGRFVITFLDTGEVCEIIQQCTTPTPTPSPTPRFFPTPTPSSTGPTPTPSSTGPTPTPTGSGVTPTPTPRPTDLNPTPTIGIQPTPTCVPFEVNEFLCDECNVVVLPPFRNSSNFYLGNITGTSEYFGPPLIYESNPSYINEDQFSCSGFIIPANSIILGYNPGSFIYTITFSEPVNEIRFVTSSGGTNNPITSIDTDYEVFTFDTNTGEPTLEICGDSCGSYVTDNNYYVTYPSTTINNGIGGGAMIKVTTPTPYTVLTISGVGGLGGTLFGICSNFEKCSYGMDVAFLIDYTGSMVDAIDSIKLSINTIVDEIERLSNSNYRLNLIIFDEYQRSYLRPNYRDSPIWNTLPSSKIYRVNSTSSLGVDIELILTSFVDFSLNNKNEFITYLNYLNRYPPAGLLLGDGVGGPEPSDIAIDRKINHSFGGSFRPGAYKLIIVITDAQPGGLDDDYTINVRNRLDLLKSQCISRSIDVLLVREPYYNDKLLELSYQTSGTMSDSYLTTNISNLIKTLCDEIDCFVDCKTFSGLPTNNQTIVYQNFTITGFSTGDVSPFTTDNRELCLTNFIFPYLPNGINTVRLFNNSQPFTYTIKFDRPVNDIMIYIISLGTSDLVNTYQRISFIVDGNTNNINLYKDPKSCNTIIDNNSVLGRSSGNDISNPERFSSNSLILVNYITNYTEITLYSNDTLSFGSVIIGICDSLCNPPVPTPTPSPTPSNTLTPTPSPTQSPTPSPTQSPTPSPSPTGPTPTPASTEPTPTPSTSPTPSPTPASTSAIQPLFDRSTFIGKVSEPYLTWLNQSCTRWETYIKFNPSIYTSIQTANPGWNGIRLSSYSLYNNPSSGVIASCGVTNFVDIIPGGTGGVQMNTFSFLLNINDNFRTIYNTQDWINILTHELGHALGIGQFWQNGFSIYGAVPPVSDFLNGSAYSNAQNAYNSIVGLSRTQIPLEASGGSGTQSAHWENDYRNASAAGSGGVDHYGVSNELMVGFYFSGLNSKLSRLSIKILVDFGYQEVSVGASEGDPGVDTSLVAENNVMSMNNLIKLNCVCDDHINIKKIGTIYIDSSNYIFVTPTPTPTPNEI